MAVNSNETFQPQRDLSNNCFALDTQTVVYVVKMRTLLHTTTTYFINASETSVMFKMINLVSDKNLYGQNVLNMLLF